MNPIYEFVTRLGWAALQGVILVALVLWICRRPRIDATTKAWLCRLAWLKLPLGLAFGGFAIPYYVSYGAATPIQGLPAEVVLAAFLGAVWLVGVAIEFVLLSAKALAARRFLSETDPSTPETQVALFRLADRLGLRKYPQIREIEGLEEPCVIGTFRSALVLPAGFSAHEDPLAAAHEMAHVRCRHLAYSALGAVTQAVFWFVPGLTALRRELALWQEAEADRIAQRALGASRTEMANRVLRAAAVAPVFGLSFGAAEVERRIRALVDANPRKGSALAGSLAALAIAAPFQFTPVLPLGERVDGPVAAEIYSPAREIRGPLIPMRMGSRTSETPSRRLIP